MPSLKLTKTSAAETRQAQSVTVVTYDYDHNGMRVRKTVANTSGYVYTTYNYTWHGDQLAHMTKGTDELHFFYDAQGRPAKVDYNGVIYTYVHNLQGDIVGILDANGTVVVEYKYNAWGTQLSRTGELANTLGYANPFRYRGYIYDDETWMYWLRSRYYYPELHRFISADNVMDGAGLFGANLYAYCKNAPVGASDPSGHFEISYSEDRAAPNWRPIGGASGDRIIGAIIGSLLYVSFRRITKVVSRVKTITSVRVTPGPSATPAPDDPPEEERKYYLAAAYGHASPMLISPAMTEKEAYIFLHVENVGIKLAQLATAKYSESGIPVALGVYTRYGRDAYNLAIRFGTPRLDVASEALYEHYNVNTLKFDEIHFWYFVRG